MNEKFAELLVDACRDSMKRCRWILTAVSIASLIIFAACWNLYFSWLRHFSMQDVWPVTTNTSIGDSVAVFNQKLLVNNWVDSGFLSVPILGVKLHTSDAAFLVALAMVILSLWLFYAMRRHNHLVGRSLRMAAERATDTIRLYIYYGITAYNVFTTISTSDFAIESIEFKDEHTKIFGIRAAFNALFFLPTAALLFIFFCDVSSMTWIHSAFRPGHPLVIVDPKETNDFIRFLFMELFCVLSIIASSILGFYCRRYHIASTKTLINFKDLIITPYFRKLDVEAARVQNLD